MATQWQTYPIEFRGGLISNLSPLQQGINAVGSATLLQNFEPNKNGGYSKLLGFEKYSTTTVPGTGPILALKVISSGRVVVARKVDSSAITTFTATASVNGATSSTTALAVDGNSGTIEVGMAVTGTGISGTPTVATVTDQNTLVLSSAQSLSDDVALTFKHLDTPDLNKTAYYYSTGTTWTFMAKSASTNGGKARHTEFNLDGDDKVIFVDGTSYPAIYNTSGNTTTFLTSSNSSDISGAEHVAMFKKHAWYAKGNNLYFSAPSNVSNFGTGSGAINVGQNVTGLTVFRDQLIVFTTDTIQKITGNTILDWSLSPITNKTGCINGDTIQEVGGDVIYLAPDGIRLLSATDRIGDFALDVASDSIHKDADSFLGTSNEFSSMIIRSKSQYRIFAYVSSERNSVAKGLIATKFIAQGSEGINWASTKGIKAYLADSRYAGDQETSMFVNDDGYVYKMETGSNFDGTNIEAIYESPFMPIEDPQLRKTFYKMTLYVTPTGATAVDLNMRYDFNSDNVIQPPTQSIASTGTSIFSYGASDAIYYAKNITYAVTVSNPGSGNKYYISDHTGPAPTLSLTRGRTYRFTQEDGSNSSHPLRFSTTENGTHNGGSEYTTGVTTGGTAGSSGAYTEITITDNTPTLYYYCTNHSDMGGTVNIVTETEVTYGGELDKIYNTNLIGSGKTVAIRIADNSTNPTFTLDTAVIEYRQNDRQ